MTFKTFHKSKCHWAIVNGRKVGPFTTEADLVRMLAPEIDLRKFGYCASKEEELIVIEWWAI